MAATVNYVRKAQKDQGECGRCGKPIHRGDAYKWVQANRFSPRLIRCNDCPTWQVWEYSDSLSARIARVDYDARVNFANEGASWEDRSEVESFLGTVADDIDGVAAEEREKAENIEEGFGHSTANSEEFTDTADSLEAWAEEFRGADVPDIESESKEPTEDELDEWHNAIETLLDELLGNDPT